jgi:hypothetical protein
METRDESFSTSIALNHKELLEHVFGRGGDHDPSEHVGRSPG